MGEEKNFENRLKKWLNSEGIYRLGTGEQDMHTRPCGYWEKRHGSVYTGGGLPDMHIVVNGVSVEAELKAPGGTVSELQKQKLNQIDDAGCLAVVLFPKDFPKFQKLIRYLKVNNHSNVDLLDIFGLERGWRR